MSDEEFIADLDGDEEPAVSGASVKPQNASIKSRARRLLKLIQKLSTQQRSAVARTGFGGMLELRFEKFPLKDVPMFYKALCDGTFVFRASDAKEFMLSKHDVHDCSFLPMGPDDLPTVPTAQMKGSKNEDNKSFKDSWRKKFGINNPKGSISLGALRDIIEALVSAGERGGDEFCRLFVLFCMSSFLAPTSNDAVDLKLLRAVENVDAIRSYDCCTYILKAMVKAGVDSNEKHTHLLGCTSFPMITYFQRFDFHGQINAHDLPLIKH